MREIKRKNDLEYLLVKIVIYIIKNKKKMPNFINCPK